MLFEWSGVLMKKENNQDSRKTVAGMALTKRELVLRIAGEVDSRQQLVFDIVQKTLDYITEALLAGRHVEFRDFGVFEVTVRKSRIGRNPNKPADVVRIPERKVVKFKPGKLMRQQLLLARPKA
jgi:nucleoid DNA-binding protein